MLSPTKPLEFDTDNILAVWQDVNKKLFEDGADIEHFDRSTSDREQLLTESWASIKKNLNKVFLGNRIIVYIIVNSLM